MLKGEEKNILEDIVNIDTNKQKENLSPELLALRALKIVEMEELLLKEEVTRRQKVMIRWIQKWNCNSKFFHRMANRSRSRKIIKSLEKQEEAALNNLESISKEIVRFFKKLYVRPFGDSWWLEDLNWPLVQKRVQFDWIDLFFKRKFVKKKFLLDMEKT